MLLKIADGLLFSVFRYFNFFVFKVLSFSIRSLLIVSMSIASIPGYALFDVEAPPEEVVVTGYRFVEGGAVGVAFDAAAAFQELQAMNQIARPPGRKCSDITPDKTRMAAKQCVVSVNKAAEEGLENCINGTLDYSITIIGGAGAIVYGGGEFSVHAGNQSNCIIAVDFKRNTAVANCDFQREIDDQDYAKGNCRVY